MPDTAFCGSWCDRHDGDGDGNWAVDGERVRQDRLEDLMKKPALCNTYIWNSSVEAHRICCRGVVRREFSFPGTDRYLASEIVVLKGFCQL